MNNIEKAREINKLSREEQVQKIVEHPHWIKYLTEQNEELCSLALKSNPRVLGLIRKQTEELCIQGVTLDYTVVSCVRELTDSIVQAALSISRDAVYYLPEVWYEKYKCIF